MISQTSTSGWDLVERTFRKDWRLLINPWILKNLQNRLHVVVTVVLNTNTTWNVLKKLNSLHLQQLYALPNARNERNARSNFMAGQSSYWNIPLGNGAICATFENTMVSVHGASLGFCVKFFLTNRHYHNCKLIHQIFTLSITIDSTGHFSWADIRGKIKNALNFYHHLDINFL